jgi:hypothetical protein
LRTRTDRGGALPLLPQVQARRTGNDVDHHGLVLRIAQAQLPRRRMIHRQGDDADLLGQHERLDAGVVRLPGQETHVGTPVGRPGEGVVVVVQVHGHPGMLVLERAHDRCRVLGGRSPGEADAQDRCAAADRLHRLLDDRERPAGVRQEA